MAGRLVRLLAALGPLLAGCGFDADPVVVELEVEVGGTATLVVPRAIELGGELDERWQLAEAPAGSVGRLAAAGRFHAELGLDVVGTYVVDRRVVLGAADGWTHRFYVDAVVAGAAAGEPSAVDPPTVEPGPAAWSLAP